MPPKKSQLKQNASYKPSKKVKKAGAKAKAVDDPLMVFEFESDDDGEVVVTPLRPRGAVPTPKQISGQSSDGNDPLTDDRLSDDTEEEDEEGSSEPEDILVGIAQERSPATALCRTLSSCEYPGGGEAEEDGEEEKHGDTTTEEELDEDGEEEKVEEVTKSADIPSITRSSTWPSRAADTEKGGGVVV
eukprot:Em0148g11a